MVADPQQHPVGANGRNAQGPQQLSRDGQVHDAGSDELLESDDAQEVPEQPDLGVLMSRDEIAGVDGVGDPIADHPHVAVDHGLTGDQDVQTGFRIERRDAGSFEGHQVRCRPSNRVSTADAPVLDA